ncbi:glutamate ABC transporter substrate-binding protein [Streptomyces sp. TRM 70361]|uniref:glutamate ABC transporter substrate-binding protein n=1 Tax=Streptomyces sp. TRM 70361 TaxID=3116553 RepID=UPI002E7C1FDB|nr:glutamate ABC transporter substrate-binding protein [Streptomyces sp. TRM 70361]MEE1938067.1 glutamate ABC transporter substrate-binding protein [Streptomyces sp. TRM 70361]
MTRTGGARTVAGLPVPVVLLVAVLAAGALLGAAVQAALSGGVAARPTVGSGPSAGPDGGSDGGSDDEPDAVPGPVRPAAGRERCADGSDPAASLRPSRAAGPAVERVRRAGRLVVGVDQNSYLWGYFDPFSREFTGFDIELVKAIATDLLGPDPEIVYKTIPTDQRIPALRRRQVDMVVRTMSITCDRIRQVAFSTAYFEAGQQILAPEDSRITGFDASLRGRRLCTAAGSTAQTLLEKDSRGARPVYADNQLDCLVRLQLGEVDAVMTDSALAAGQAAQDPSVRLVGDPLTVEPYGVAMNLGDEDLVRRVNKVLEDYRRGGADSAWTTAYERWLADRMETAEPAPPAPAYRD